MIISLINITKLQAEMKIFCKTLRPGRERVWFRSPELSEGKSQEKTVAFNFPKRWNIVRYTPDITNQPRCIFFPLAWDIKTGIYPGIRMDVCIQKRISVDWNVVSVDQLFITILKPALCSLHWNSFCFAKFYFFWVFHWLLICLL